MSLINIVHTVLGFIALISGAANLLLPKGTQLHRRIGTVFAISMALLLVSSFGIFDLFAGFGPYHAMSLFSGLTLALAIYFPLRRRQHPGWLEHHYMWITYTYVGLVMATNSHLIHLGPAGWSDTARMALWWGGPLAIGTVLIYSRRASSKKKAMANMRESRKLGE